MSLSSNSINTADDFFVKKEAVIVKTSDFLLTQTYSNNGKDLHVFVEDQDDYEFYRTALNYTFPDYQILPYYQKGKKNVKKAYESLDWSRFKKSKILFFMDKDFDDILAKNMLDDHNVFYTKFYSIENYLINDDSLNIIFKRYHNIDNSHLMNFLLEEYKKAFNVFRDFIEKITPFIMIYRELEKHLILDELKLHHFLKFFGLEAVSVKFVELHEYRRITRSIHFTNKDKASLRKITIKSHLKKHCEADLSLIDLKNLIRNKNKIKAISEPKTYIRGKFEVWFFLEFFKNIELVLEKHFDSGSKAIYFENKISYPKRRTELNDTNLIDLVANKIEIPQDVKEFLLLNFNLLNGNY